MKLKCLLISLALGLLLGACGGGSITLANGGIGGTGISTGTITAFGSIFVNGVEYDVSSANFTRNGVLVSGQAEYAIGEYVTVQGSINADGITGTANTVSFDNRLKGGVTTVSTDGATLGVLGQSVRTNALTVFKGFTLLADLATGNVVEISGVQDAQGEWLASSIRLLGTAPVAGDVLELEGTVQQLDALNQRFVLGSLTVDYAQASLQGFPDGGLANGQYLAISSQQALQGSHLTASTVVLTSPHARFGEGTKVELEGVITRFVSSNNFSVNGVTVSTDAGTVFQHGVTHNNLSLNAVLEVEGQINASGALLARTIRVKESEDTPITELEGTITRIDTATQSFVLGSATVVVDTTTLWEDHSTYVTPQLTLDQLNVGDTLEVHVNTLGDGRLLALRVERGHGDAGGTDTHNTDQTAAAATDTHNTDQTAAAATDTHNTDQTAAAATDTHNTDQTAAAATDTHNTDQTAAAATDTHNTDQTAAAATDTHNTDQTAAAATDTHRTER